jgi:hypothetical protein
MLSNLGFFSNLLGECIVDGLAILFNDCRCTITSDPVVVKWIVGYWEAEPL